MSLAVEEVLGRIKSLEPLPQVCVRVMDLAAEPDASPNDLIGVIHTDPGITAKVLKLCNSAYYGFARRIDSLAEAGVLLGVNTLVNLVITACAGRYFRDFGNVSSQTSKRLWQHTVTNALAASMIARVHGRCDANRAYTVGLLQDMGAMVFERFFPVERTEIRRALAADPTLDPQETERALLGLDHAELGALLAEQWRFPDVLVDSIRCHHAPERATIDPTMASIAHLAHAVAEAHEAGEGLDHVAYALGPGALGLAGLDASRLQALEELIEVELDRAREFLA